MSCRRFWCGLCGLVALSAQAEDPLDPIVVTPTRTPGRLTSSLASVDVVTRDQILRSQAVDVTDLLRFQPGVELARYGGPGQPTSIFLRGANSNHSLILLDGVPINPGTVGNAPLQNIRPELVERIEVVKGPLSSLYGSQAIGGVINIIPRRAPAPQGLHTQGRLAAGGQDTREGWVGVQGSDGRLQGGMDLDYLSTDGFPTLLGSDQNRGFRNTNLQAYGGYTWDTADLRLSHWQANGHAEYLDPGTGVILPLDNDFGNSLTTLALDLFPRADWRSQLRLSYLADRIDQNQVNPYSGSEDSAHTYRTRLDWQNELTLSPDNLLTLGLFSAVETVNSQSFGTQYGVRTRQNQVFAQDNVTFGPHRWILAGGLYQDEDAGGHGTWNLSYGYQWSPELRLSTGAGTAFKAPDSTQRFGFGGNPDLEPEQSFGVDLAVHYAPAPGQRLSLTGFYQRIQDLIQFEGDFISGRNENVGKARNQGIEAAYGVQGGHWLGNVALVLQDPINQDTGEPLLRRSKEQLTAALVYGRGDYELGGNLLAVGEREDFNGTLGSYWVLNLTGRYRLAPHWFLEARIENLFDEDYEPVKGYNNQGRLAVLGIRYGGPAE